MDWWNCGAGREEALLLPLSPLQERKIQRQVQPREREEETVRHDMELGEVRCHSVGSSDGCTVQLRDAVGAVAPQNQLTKPSPTCQSLGSAGQSDRSVSEHRYELTVNMQKPSPANALSWLHPPADSTEPSYPPCAGGRSPRPSLNPRPYPVSAHTAWWQATHDMA